MKQFVLVALLALGVVAGCGSLTPAEVQDAIAKLNKDMPLIRHAVGQVTTNSKLLSDLDIIASNAAAMDQIVNH